MEVVVEGDARGCESVVIGRECDTDTLSVERLGMTNEVAGRYVPDADAPAIVRTATDGEADEEQEQASSLAER